MLSVGLGDNKRLHGTEHFIRSQQHPTGRVEIQRALQGLEAGFETLKLALNLRGQLHARQSGWDKPPVSQSSAMPV